MLSPAEVERQLNELRLANEELNRKLKSLSSPITAEEATRNSLIVYPNVTTGGSGGTAIPAPLAPNVVSISGITANYTAVGNIPYFYMSCGVVMPTTHTNYSHLTKLRVWAQSGTQSRILVGENSAPFTLSITTFFFTSILVNRPSDTGTTYTFTFEVLNEDGVATPNPVTATLPITVAPPLGGVDGNFNFDSISGVETGSRTSNIFGSPYLHLTTTVGASGGYNGQYTLATLWLSKDNGVNFQYISFYNVTLDGSFEASVTFDVIVPTAANGSWKMAAVMGAITGDPSILIPAASLPSNAIISSTITITRVPLCNATDVTSISFLNYPATSDRFKYGINSNGVSIWSWYGLQMTLPSIATSYQFFDAVFTVQLGKVVAGVFTPKPDDPEGIERPFGQSSLATQPPGTVGYGQTIIFYGPSAAVAWTLPSPYLPGTSTANPYNTFRIKVYANSRREGEPAWQVQQSGWSGSALFFDLVPVNQTGRLDLGTADPITTGGGGGVQIDPNNPNGRPVIVTTNPIYSALPDFGFEFSADGNMAGNVNWGPNGSGSCTVFNTGGFSGPRFCRIQGAGEYLQDLYGIPCQYGVPIYASLALRSNNVGAPHSISLKLVFIDNTSSVISTTTVGTFSGFQSAWLDKGITGQVFPPATAWRCFVKLELNAAETVSGYFDVDDIILQRVLDQVGNGQSQSGVQVPNPSGYSGYNSYHITTTAASYYGLSYAEILASNGDFFSVQCDTGVCQITLTRGVNQSVLTATQIQFGGGAGIMTSTGLRINSANGRNESLAAAIAAGTRQVVGGIIT